MGVFVSSFKSLEKQPEVLRLCSDTLWLKDRLVVGVEKVKIAPYFCDLATEG